MIKLLHPNHTSYGGCRWEVGVWKETDGRGELCGPGWLHGYDTVELALLLNPIHANIYDPIAYRVECGGRRKDDRGLKFGVTRMRLVEPVALPCVTLDQRVRFAIRCAVAVYRDPAFLRWARAWLTNQDRSTAGARAAAGVAAGVAAGAAAEWAAGAAAEWAAVGAAVGGWTATAAAAAAAEWASPLPFAEYARWALTDSLALGEAQERT